MEIIWFFWSLEHVSKQKNCPGIDTPSSQKLLGSD